MRIGRLLLLASWVLASGCIWPVRQRTDQMVCRIANQPYDLRPDSAAAIAKPSALAKALEQPSVAASNAQKPAVVPAASDPKRNEFRSTTGPRNELRYLTDQKVASSDQPLDVRAASWLESQGPVRRASAQVEPTVADQRMLELDIPSNLPGSETPPVVLPLDDPARQRALEMIYPELPPLPVEPPMLPGPAGRPYTLTDLQQIAAANSPAVRQAVADVHRAAGVRLQAGTYQNPTGTYFVDPTNNNATTGVQGIGIEQVITTGGKKKLAAAVAQKDVENARLALRRARNDLATRVRQAYFALLVDKETLAVSRAVARFTDEMYELQTRLARSQAGAYEPASLRAQAFSTRLAYQQAIATYLYDWKSLVAVLNLRQLPLTQVAGEIDRFIPYYDYDQVLAHVVRNHTDILRARNLVPQARYNLKLAQVAIVPDLDVSYKFARDFTVLPFGTYQQFQLQMPLGVWDRNKGNIIAAQAALVRAGEEQHNSEMDLTNRLADAYTNYQNNLYAIDYYRRYILPDLVRYYRGVYSRRMAEPDAVNVGDLAFAEQNLSQNVTAYLGVLRSMWQSVVSVADLLQTDDLFQMATPRPLPELPDFEELSRWACGHAHVAARCGVDTSGGPMMAAPTPLSGNVAPTLRSGGPRSTIAAPVGRGSPDPATPVRRGSPDPAGRRPSVATAGSVGDRPEPKNRPEQKLPPGSVKGRSEPKPTAQSVGAKRSGQ